MSFVSDIFDTGAGGVVGSVVSNLFNIDSTRSTNAANLRYAREAEERERAYNHPTAQMERLREAGLNPNLIYGSGTETGNLSARTVNMDAPVVTNPLEAVRSIQELKNLKATGENISALTTESSARTKNLEEQNSNLRAQNALTKAQTIKAIQDATGWTTQRIKFSLPWLFDYSYDSTAPRDDTGGRPSTPDGVKGVPLTGGQVPNLLHMLERPRQSR